jgi:hypothetical protein
MEVSLFVIGLGIDVKYEVTDLAVERLALR